MIKDIDILAAGREMDALVAEKVMGYVTRKVQGGEVWSPGTIELSDRLAEEARGTFA